MKIFCVVGARPNFVKMARLYWALAKLHGPETRLIHTGQHTGQSMSDSFFQQLGLPTPHYTFTNAKVLSPNQRLGAMMMAMESALRKEGPGLVVVVGDVDSTLAAALAAQRLDYPIAHVEAGLRSGDRSMPEEINRRLVDQLATLLFCSEDAAIDNLRNEGMLRRDEHKGIFLVGNTMIDTLIHFKDRIDAYRFDYSPSGVPPKWGVATLHRPANVDNREQLREILLALQELAVDWNIHFRIPMHPRLERQINHLPELQPPQRYTHLLFEGPRPYLEFVAMVKQATIVCTDSGGVQEEAAYFETPCLTLRENTERPCTLWVTNRLAGITRESIRRVAEETKKGIIQPVRHVPALWRDGKASERIAQAISQWLMGGIP